MTDIRRVEAQIQEKHKANIFLQHACKKRYQLKLAGLHVQGVQVNDTVYPTTMVQALDLLNVWQNLYNIEQSNKQTGRNQNDRNGGNPNRHELSFLQAARDRGRWETADDQPRRRRDDDEDRGDDRSSRSAGRGRDGRRNRTGRGGRGRGRAGRDAQAHAQDADDASTSSSNYSNDQEDAYSQSSIDPDEDIQEVEHTFLQEHSSSGRSVKKEQRRTLPKTWVILDSGSTASIFCNPQLLTGVHTASRPLTVRCNAGVVRLNKQGYFGSYPEPVWLNPNGIANILSKHEVSQHYRVRFDNWQDAGYFVTLGENDVRFGPSSSGLYFKDFGTNTDAGWFFFATVKGAKSVYRKSHVIRAARARRAQNIVGRPGDRQFSKIIKLIKRCDVEQDDINRASKIYGANLGSLKGKTPARTNTSVVATVDRPPESILDEYKQVILAVDIMFINKIPFLVTKSRDLQFGTVEQLENRQAPTFIAAIRDVVALYKARHFKVSTILADMEFACINNEFPNIHVDICGVDDHIPEVERYIRTLKDRTRSQYNVLPFTHISKLVLRRMVENANFWLNAFPPTDGVSQEHSPRYIMTGRDIDMHRHVRCEFGAYVQTHEEHDNSMNSRTIGAICLGPTGSAHGTHYFMSLATGSRIARQNWTELPMPNDVIQAVSAFGRAQNMPATLTFTDRHGKELLDENDEIDDNHDSDYDPDSDDDDESDDDDDDDDDDSDDESTISDDDDDNASSSSEDTDSSMDEDANTGAIDRPRVRFAPPAGVNHAPTPQGNPGD